MKEQDQGISVRYYYPSADLRDIVKYYWIVRVNDTSGNKKLAKISPSGFPEMIFHFADSVSINTRSGNLAHQPYGTTDFTDNGDDSYVEVQTGAIENDVTWEKLSVPVFFNSAYLDIEADFYFSEQAQRLND